MWVLFDRRRQGWHDKIACTFVVDADDEFSDANAVNMVPSDSKFGWYWVLLWIIFMVGAPLGLLTTGLALGPFVTNFLKSIFQGAP